MGLGFRIGAKNSQRVWQIIRGTSIVFPSKASGNVGGSWQGQVVGYDDDQGGNFSASLTLDSSCIGMRCKYTWSGQVSGRFGDGYTSITAGGVTHGTWSLNTSSSGEDSFIVTSSNRTINMSGSYGGSSRMWKPETYMYITSLICEDV